MKIYCIECAMQDTVNSEWAPLPGTFAISPNEAWQKFAKLDPAGKFIYRCQEYQRAVNTD